MTTTRSGRVTRGEYELLARFRYGLRRFLRFSEETARAAGVTPQQHQALLAVKGFPGPGNMTVGELAERLQVRPHSALGLVERMIERSLMSRARDSGDRRQVRLRLTRRGETVLRSLTESHRAELRRLGPEWMSALHRILADTSRADDAARDPGGGSSNPRSVGRKAR